MHNAHYEAKLLKLFQVYIEGEKRVESNRLAMALKDHFDPLMTFKYIDKNNIGFITAYDLHKFLRDHGLIVIDRDIKNLMKLYDFNKDGMLSYTEYLYVILPNTNAILSKMCGSRRISRDIIKNEGLMLDARQALAQVFDKEIDLIRKLELLKEDIAQIPGISILELYKILDNNPLEGISPLRLKEFFDQNNIQLADDDEFALMKRLDRDNDGKISYNEFIQGVIPLSQIANTGERISAPVGVLIKERIKTSRSPNRTQQQQDSPDLKYSARSSYRREDQEGFVSAREKSPISSQITKKYTDPNEQKPEIYQNMRTRTTMDSFSPLDPPQVTSSLISSPFKGSPLKSLPRLSPSLPKSSPTISTRGNEESHLAELLRVLFEIEITLEVKKSELALREDFNLMDAFRLFDKNAKGYIQANELKDALERFDMYPDESEMFLLMKGYDSDDDGIFRFTDFCNMISPKDPDFIKNLMRRPPSFISDDRLYELFSDKTNEILGNILNQIVVNEVLVENLKQRLTRRPSFNPKEIFNGLDSNQKGYITIDDIKEFLIKYRVYLSYNDLVICFRKFDKQNKGKITHEEFINEITPKLTQTKSIKQE